MEENLHVIIVHSDSEELTTASVTRMRFSTLFVQFHIIIIIKQYALIQHNYYHQWQHYLNNGNQFLLVEKN